MKQPVWKMNEESKKAECFALEVCVSPNGDGVEIGRTIFVMIPKYNVNIASANYFLGFSSTSDITTNKRGLTILFSHTSHETTGNVYTSINILLLYTFCVPLELDSFIQNQS